MRTRITVALLALALTGCSALGERQVALDVDVAPEVEGRVLEGNRLVGAFTGRTTRRPTLRADETHVFVVEAEGCEPVTVTFTPRTQGGDVAAFLLKCVILPPALVLFPFMLEAGAFAQFEPDHASVKLVRLGASAR